MNLFLALSTFIASYVVAQPEPEVFDSSQMAEQQKTYRAAYSALSSRLGYTLYRGKTEAGRECLFQVEATPANPGTLTVRMRGQQTELPIEKTDPNKVADWVFPIEHSETARVLMFNRVETKDKSALRMSVSGISKQSVNKSDLSSGTIKIAHHLSVYFKNGQLLTAWVYQEPSPKKNISTALKCAIEKP